MAKTRWTSLRKIDGFVFSTGNPTLNASWDWIKNSVANEFECSPDDLDLIDDEDGDFVVLNGEKIVEVCAGMLRNEARPLVQLREVA
jgi:hypothetical protein